VLAVVSLCRVTWHKDKRGLVTAYLFLQTGVVVCVLNQITI
jgi:acyl-CoA thioesterase